MPGVASQPMANMLVCVRILLLTLGATMLSAFLWNAVAVRAFTDIPEEFSVFVKFYVVDSHFRIGSPGVSLDFTPTRCNKDAS